MDIGRIKVSRTLVGVKGVRSLVVAGLVLGHGQVCSHTIKT
jgi:hypothetical protein